MGSAASLSQGNSLVEPGGGHFCAAQSVVTMSHESTNALLPKRLGLGPQCVLPLEALLSEHEPSHKYV